GEARYTMLHRVVSLLLVPTLLLQGVSFAHSHIGTGVQEPVGHDQTPHFHWHFVGTPALLRHDDEDQDADDDHANNEAPGLVAPATDHDKDTVYVPLSVMLGWRRQQSTVVSEDCSALLAMAWIRISPQEIINRLLPQPRPPPLLLYWQCPIYLR